MIISHFPASSSHSSFDFLQPSSPSINSERHLKMTKSSTFLCYTPPIGESSFNSSFNTDCSLSDDSKEETVSHQKSKYQMTLERRHRNFEIKKKTEVSLLVIKKFNL